MTDTTTYAHLFAGGELVSINPASHFVDEPGFVMDLVQRMAGESLSKEQYDRAARLGVAAAAKTARPTLRVLVDAWRADQCLADFAERLAAAAMLSSAPCLPGATPCESIPRF